MENEPNEQKPESIDSLVDKAFEGEAPAESSPPTPAPVVTPKEGSDPLKTQSKEKPADFEGTPEGFRGHPAWTARETKLKEAQAQIASLLGDPVVFKRQLERQGYSKDEVIQVMRQRGMVIEESTATTAPALTKNEADAFVISVCQKKGWDYDNLSTEQKSYIRDLIGMTDTVFEMKAESLLSKRLKPIEDKFNSMETERGVQTSFESARQLATKYKFDFDKDIMPSVQARLDELDQIDPLNKVRFDLVSFTKDSILQLLEEKQEQQVRQETRTNLKKGATPLKPGAFQPSDSKSVKGKTVSETVDAWMDAAGIKG